MSAHPPASPLDPPLMGRADEVAVLAQHLDGVRVGTGGSIRISGEAGVGKTRLVADALADDHLVVVRGTAEEAEQGRPFAALARALSIDGLYHPTPSNGVALGADATWLAIDRLVGEVETVAGNGPLVMVLDDLQWADQGTWLAAAALARRAESMGLLLITMHRPLRPSETAPLPLAALGQSIELGPLGPKDALELGASVMASRPDDTAAAQLGRGAGNPFFTIEIARWLDEGHGATWSGAAEDLELSPVLRATVLDRVDTLGPVTVAVLRSAALLGRRTTVAELGTLTSQPVDVVARAIEDASAVGLLMDRADGISFRHDLVRAAIRAATPPAVVAAHVSARTDEAVADPWAARQLAGQAHAGDESAARVIAGAARAPGVAPETVALLLEELLRIGPPSVEAPGAVATDLVIALARSGDLGPAAERGRALLRDAAAGDLAGLRRIVARLDVGRGDMDAAIDGLREVAAGVGPTALQASADCYLVETMTLRRPDAVQDARDIRTDATDPTVRCHADLTVAVDAMRTGRLAESVDAARSAVAQTALEPMLTAEIHPEVFLANALFYAERFDEAAEALAHARRAAERAEVVWPIPHHLAHVAGVALRTGDLEGARTASREAIGWSLDTGQRIGGTWPHVLNAAVAVYAGEPDEARGSLALAEADMAAGRWQGTEAVPWATALVTEADGNPAGAAAGLAPIVELALALGWHSRLPLLAPEAARMAWVARDRAIVERMVEVTESLAHMDTVEAEAALVRCRGLAAGDPALLGEAAARYESIGSAMQVAATWAEASLVTARTGNHDLSVDLFEREARPRIDAIGADGILERTLGALPVRVQRRLGRRPDRPTEGAEALTPAERRVAELVATGATNTDIAGDLNVSRRTVESHLGRIYRKLGVSSRVKLATAGITASE